MTDFVLLATIATYRYPQIPAPLMPDQLRNIFDLKGSSVNRLVTGQTKSTDTLKDTNFLQLKKRNPKLTKMDQQTSSKLGTIMSNDVRFLKKNNLMDYSLLLGIEKSQNYKRYTFDA